MCSLRLVCGLQKKNNMYRNELFAFGYFGRKLATAIPVKRPNWSSSTQ